MHALPRCLIGLFLCAVLSPAAAQDDRCGGESAVTLQCSHTAAGPSVSLLRSRAPSRGDCRDLRVERFGRNDLGRARAIEIAAGEAGECRFADGRSVRVRALRESAPLLGACNADAAVSFSLWVDGYKRISRGDVRPRCATFDAPWRYRIDASGVYDCGGAACVALADSPGAEIDAVEYPPPGRMPPKAGTLQRLLDRHPVCAVVERELRADWSAFDAIGRNDNKASELQRLNRSHGTRIDTPPPNGVGFAYGGGRSDDFDFDNDGLIDRVHSSDTDGQGSWYFSPLLIEAGSARESFVARGDGAEPTAVPCQWDPARPVLQQCDDLRNDAWPSGQRPTQALPAPVAGVNADREFFRTRYTTTLPFRFQGQTYVALWSAGAPSRDYVGIYRPRPRGEHEAVCLIHRVPPHM